MEGHSITAAVAVIIGDGQRDRIVSRQRVGVRSGDTPRAVCFSDISGRCGAVAPIPDGGMGVRRTSIGECTLEGDAVDHRKYKLSIRLVGDVESTNHRRYVLDCHYDCVAALGTMVV